MTFAEVIGLQGNLVPTNNPHQPINEEGMIPSSRGRNQFSFYEIMDDRLAMGLRGCGKD